MYTLKEWQIKDPATHQAFMESLELDSASSEDNRALSDKLKAFMASTKNDKAVIEESNEDVEEVLELFIQGRDTSTFNPLDFYKSQKTFNFFFLVESVTRRERLLRIAHKCALRHMAREV